MKERGQYLLFALAAAIGVLTFFSYDFMGKLLFRQSSAPLFSPLPLRSEVNFSSEEEQQNFFLPSYPEEDLRSFRDIFFAPLLIVPQEGFIATTEGTVSASREIALESPPEEKLPQIVVKGVVTSPQGRAVIVEKEGKVFILTSQKPLQEEMKLVRIEGKQVVLEYQGREFSFLLEK
ncbi:MAG: hypothetical protein ACUVQZ_05080 [Candidatus Caldatribacteriaceae bacterium]